MALLTAICRATTGDGKAISLMCVSFLVVVLTLYTYFWDLCLFPVLGLNYVAYELALRSRDIDLGYSRSREADLLALRDAVDIFPSRLLVDANTVPQVQSPDSEAITLLTINNTAQSTFSSTVTSQH